MKLSVCCMSLLADKETARVGIKVSDVCSGLSPFYLCTWEFLFQQLWAAARQAVHLFWSDLYFLFRF